MDVLNSCDVCRIDSPNRNSPASSRASRTVPLPFWRGTIKPTSGVAHVPSGRSPNDTRNTSCCHGYRCSPADAARSTASCPAEVEKGGQLLTRGVREPCRTSSSELVTRRGLLCDRHGLDLRDHRSEFLHQGDEHAAVAHAADAGALVLVLVPQSVTGLFGQPVPDGLQ